MKRLEWNYPDSTPYDAVTAVIEQFAMRNGYESFVVRLSLDGYETNELLILDGNYSCQFEWNNDWWEGQKDVYLIGYVPLSEIRVNNI